MINSPHDPAVRYGDQRQVPEPVDAGAVARFMTDSAVTATVEQHNESLTKLQPRLVERQVIPAQQYVDQGYMSGGNLARRLAHGFVREGIVSKRPEFRLSQFEIDLDPRRAICPAGKRCVKWANALPDVATLMAYHVSFGRHCRTGPFFGPDLCTDKASRRHLGVSRYQVLRPTRRREADPLAFQTDMHVRAGIEGTLSERVRAHGARRARYRGLAKTQLPALCIATATNLKRLARTFTALFPAPCAFSSRPLCVALVA